MVRNRREDLAEALSFGIQRYHKTSTAREKIRFEKENHALINKANEAKLKALEFNASPGQLDFKKKQMKLEFDLKNLEYEEADNQVKKQQMILKDQLKLQGNELGRQSGGGFVSASPTGRSYTAPKERSPEQQIKQNIINQVPLNPGQQKYYDESMKKQGSARVQLDETYRNLESGDITPEEAIDTAPRDASIRKLANKKSMEQVKIMSSEAKESYNWKDFVFAPDLVSKFGRNIKRANRVKKYTGMFNTGKDVIAFLNDPYSSEDSDEKLEYLNEQVLPFAPKDFGNYLVKNKLLNKGK